MPTVQGKVAKPDLSAKDVTSVTVELIDGFGNPVRAFRTATKETIVGPQSVTVTNGVWTAVLPDNAGLNPANTRYRRRIHLPGGVTIDDLLIVPVGGGPYDEEDILAEPLAAPPLVTASSEVDDFEIATNGSPVAVNGLAVASLDTRGDLVIPAGTPRRVWAHYAVGVASSVANANIGVAIGPPGTTAIADMFGAGWAQATAASAIVTVPVLVSRPAGWAGTLRLYSMSAQGGNVTLQGTAFAPSRGVAMLAGSAT